ncbi:hypothetical protein [Nocardia sp. N2S4-5]|uniref:hypothetical protein n=1 Tax=Nocardia sp. N2S4-5 TaxID=3351565 RepID=UPI0037D55B48
MATIAASPTNNELRVSNGIVDTDRSLKEAEKFESLTRELASGKLGIVRFFLLTPRWALVKFLRNLALILMTWLKLRPAKEPEPSAESGYGDILRSATESKEMLQSALMEYATIGALRVRMEQQRHLPRYFSVEPYIRLALNRAFFEDERGDEEDAFEISLMIHRSGVCAMTFSAGVGRCLGIKDLRRCIYSGDRHLRWVKISVPIMARFARREGIRFKYRTLRRSNLEHAENQKWLKISASAEAAKFDDKPLSVQSVFEAYLKAVESIAGRQSTDGWDCYSTLSLGAPICCYDHDAKIVHRDEFSQLMLRTLHDVELEESTKHSLLKNHLKILDKELWLSARNAIYVDWNGAGPDLIDDIHILIPIESAMLQAKQLEQIDGITSDAVVRDRSLFKSQNILAVGLQEYRRYLLAGPDDSAIVDAVLEINDYHSLYTRLLERVKLLESLVSARYSRMQSRRSVGISVAGFMVVLFALLPRISETLEEFARKGGWAASLVGKIDSIFGGRDPATLWIYVAILSISLCMILMLSFRFRLSLPRRKTFGKRIPRDISIVVVNEAPVVGE